jgi:hypothetical protein
MMKKKNKYEILAITKSNKPTIMSINPNIKKIVIEMNFSENVEYFHKPYSSVLTPIDKAFFAPNCINSSCTKGYFDISSEIHDLIKHNKYQVKGTKTCDGWQDEERIWNHQCLAKINYKITAEYND